MILVHSPRLGTFIAGADEAVAGGDAYSEPTALQGDTLEGKAARPKVRGLPKEASPGLLRVGLWGPFIQHCYRYAGHFSFLEDIVKLLKSPKYPLAIRHT